MTDYFSVFVTIITVVVGGMGFYILTMRMGRRSKGSGTKYQPFTGGEELPRSRGKYHSSLFVYAALFMAFDVFALLLASAVSTTIMLWPLLFTMVAGVGLFVIITWFVTNGGSEL